MRKILKCILLVTYILCIFVSCSQPPQPVSVIFDTDMGPDYDDVGALTILHALADSGEAKILATVSSNMYAHAVPCIEVINTYFNRPDIPLGAPRKGPTIFDNRFGDNYWADFLPAKYPHTVKNTADAPDAVQVYRRILSGQPDTSVNIITVGFLTNLAALLQSSPDQFSNLDGKALVKKKVRRLISMAGSFPRGREFNVCIDSVASVTVFNEWPTPVLLSGFEIGRDILTGLRLTADDVQNSPTKDAFRLCLKVDVKGRCSWDQTAALVGVRGAKKYFDTVKGRMTALPNGNNTWQDDPNGPHERLVWKMPKEQLTILIEDLMMHQPIEKTKDKEEIQNLIRQTLKWADSKDVIDVLPMLTDNQGKEYIGFDLIIHKSNLDILKTTGFFANEFIENYNQIILTLDKKLRNHEFEKWLVGYLPPFRFANDVNPWCACQDVPYDHPSPWDNVKIEVIELNNDSAQLLWRWGRLDLNTHPSVNEFSYQFRTVKEDGKWKIAYLQEFEL